MARELKNTAIHNLLESAGRSIPDLDGHNIRIAERRILWSKLAQQAPASAGAAPLMPPSATPEQIEAWNKPHTFEEWEEQIKHQQPMSNAQVMDTESWKAQNNEDELSQLLRPRVPAKSAPTGVAHVQRPATRQTSPAESVIQLPEMNIEGDPNEMLYTPGPDDPNYTGASKGISGLLKVADYLSKKS